MHAHVESLWIGSLSIGSRHRTFLNPGEPIALQVTNTFSNLEIKVSAEGAIGARQSSMSIPRDERSLDHMLLSSRSDIGDYPRKTRAVAEIRSEPDS